MILDFRIHPTTPECARYIGGVCLVDGVRVRNVFYADSEQGIVKTYDVANDGNVHTSGQIKELFADNDGLLPPDVEVEPSGALYKTVTGRVEFFTVHEDPHA
jgi:hypothetical protein